MLLAMVTSGAKKARDIWQRIQCVLTAKQRGEYGWLPKLITLYLIGVTWTCSGVEVIGLHGAIHVIQAKPQRDYENINGFNGMG